MMGEASHSLIPHAPLSPAELIRQIVSYPTCLSHQPNSFAKLVCYVAYECTPIRSVAPSNATSLPAARTPPPPSILAEERHARRVFFGNSSHDVDGGSFSCRNRLLFRSDGLLSGGDRGSITGGWQELRTPLRTSNASLIRHTR